MKFPKMGHWKWLNECPWTKFVIVSENMVLGVASLPVQWTPWNMHTIQPCFVLLWLDFLTVTKQLLEWSCLSVRPFVCQSVTPFSLCSCHHIIMKFFRNYYHWLKWCPCRRSRSKVKVTNFDPIWVFPDSNSNLKLEMAKKWCTKLEVA